MTLQGRLEALAGAVRDKLNLMVPRLLPSGGTTGQVLAKSSGTNYATGWVDPASGGGNTTAFAMIQSTYTLVSTTAYQPLFNTSPNGALTLSTGIYRLRCLLTLGSMSTTSGNANFSLVGAGTATVGKVGMHSVGADTSIPSSPTSQDGAFVSSTTFSTRVVGAGTGSSLCVEITGLFEVTTAGTIIPSIALATAAAAGITSGSHIEITQVGSGGAYGGNWS